MSSPPLFRVPDLFSSAAAVRAVSATAIYNEGLALAGPALSLWLANQELSRLVGEQPLATVGLAVPPDIFVLIRQANGNPHLAHVPDDMDAEEFELHFAAQVSLDILTTRDPNGDGAIARYLKRFGQGIQQVEYRCSDVERATAILKAAFGVTPIYPQTRPGADSTRINFFLVPSSGGGKVLIELYEVPETIR